MDNAMRECRERDRCLDTDHLSEIVIDSRCGSESAQPVLSRGGGCDPSGPTHFNLCICWSGLFVVCGTDCVSRKASWPARMVTAIAHVFVADE